MAYAVIDYTEKKWMRRIRVNEAVGEVNIFVPSFKISQSCKFVKKILKILDKSKINTVLLNKDLMANDLFCNELLKNKKYIISGRRIYKVLLIRCLKDISNQMKINLSQLKVCLLLNEYSLENNDLIRNIAKEVKTLIVITEHKEKYNKLINELFEVHGIILKVFDKNKTNFKHVNIIVNIDFEKEEMEKINTNNNALIICGFTEDYKVKNRFNGIVVRKIDVISPIERECLRIGNIAMCEAKIYNYLRKIKENDRVFEREGYKINGYLGENGKIRADEFEKLGKIILDK